MKIERDFETNILSWELNAREFINNTLVLGDFLVHISRSGKPVLIEILGADKFLKKMSLKNLNKEFFKNFLKIAPDRLLNKN